MSPRPSEWRGLAAGLTVRYFLFRYRLFAAHSQRTRERGTARSGTPLDRAIDGDCFRRLGAPAHPGLRRLRDRRNQLCEKIRPRPSEVAARTR
jgi:hypothetical protein